MPRISDNHSAYEENNRRKNDPVSKYKELLPTLHQFAKNSSHLFYFHLEECRIGSSYDGNIEVCYQATDENGKDRTFWVEVLDGSLRLRGLKKMCNGTDKKTYGPIPITPENAYIQFRSAVMLFLTDLGLWSSKHNIVVDNITFPPKESKLAFQEELPSKELEGESDLWYKFTGDYTYSD